MMPLSATSFLRRFTVSASGYALLTRTMPSSVSARVLVMLNSRSPAIKTAETAVITRAIIWLLLLSSPSKSATREDHREQNATRLPKERLVLVSTAVSDEMQERTACRQALQRAEASLRYVRPDRG